jgi:hypothetical protein
MNAEDAWLCYSTVGADFGTTGFPRYAKEVQLDWRGVPEDGSLVVLIHKQFGCLVPDRYAVVLGAQRRRVATRIEMVDREGLQACSSGDVSKGGNPVLDGILLRRGCQGGMTGLVGC